MYGYSSDSARIEISSYSTHTVMIFQAFITDFSDSYNSNWSNQEIYGRMDPIYTYKNTVRKITLAFDVPSFSKTDAIANMNYADNMIKSMYPVYNEESDGKGVAIMRTPPLFRIKLANLIQSAATSQGLLGYIDNFNFKPDIASGFIDLSINNSRTLAPKLYKVNFNFFVIHEHALGNIIKENQTLTRSPKEFPHNYSLTLQQNDLKSNVVKDTETGQSIGASTNN